MEIEAGTVLADRYRVQRPLGRGGMGEVFAAENVRTGRVVAVKVLRADAKQKSSAVARFQREARAAGAIHSDYVTQVLDVEEDDEHGILIVFEMLEGESLIERLKRTGPMSFEELFPLVEQVWMGLVDAHKAGVIHRDLKPSNVFLERRPDGGVRVKLLDFGISKLPREVGGETLTEMGQSLGTFSFMPPEQIGKAKTVDHRADIYAVATLIYQALSGQLPYAARNILQMVELKTKNEPRKLGDVLDRPVDPALERFLAKALARDPENRHDSAAEALDAWRELRRSMVGLEPSSVGAVGMSASGMNASASHAAGRPSQSPAQGPAPVIGLAASGGGPSAAPQPGSGSYAAPRIPTVSGIPSVVDNTSESSAGDQIATVAMPVHQVRQAVQQRAAAAAASPGAGLPKLHDDRPGSGTQLIPRTGGPLGASGVQPRAFPPEPPAPRPGFAPPGAPPSSSGFGGAYGSNLAASGSNLAASGSNPRSGTSGVHPAAGAGLAQGPSGGANPQQPDYEGGPPGDLTTVYRRDATSPGVGAGGVPAGPSSERPSSKLGMIVGVVVFAVVGFAIAAFAIQLLQGR